MHISPRGVLERASYPISGTDSRHTSTFGTGGPTVPSMLISFGSETNVPAQVSVRPTLTLIQNKDPNSPCRKLLRTVLETGKKLWTYVSQRCQRNFNFNASQRNSQKG